MTMVTVKWTEYCNSIQKAVQSTVLYNAVITVTVTISGDDVLNAADLKKTAIIMGWSPSCNHDGRSCAVAYCISEFSGLLL